MYKLIFLAIFTSLITDDVYKCEKQGKHVFYDIPCDYKEEKVDVTQDLVIGFGYRGIYNQNNIKPKKTQDTESPNKKEIKILEQESRELKKKTVKAEITHQVNTMSEGSDMTENDVIKE